MSVPRFQEDGLNGTIILEPQPRNTAPAIALAALAVLEESDRACF